MAEFGKKHDCGLGSGHKPSHWRGTPAGVCCILLINSAEEENIFNCSD